MRTLQPTLESIRRHSKNRRSITDAVAFAVQAPVTLASKEERGKARIRTAVFYAMVKEIRKFRIRYNKY